ncbi:MAG: stage III sporulation protein AE, partial [Lachnospiraceae bacterium]|nr:stage III sporulation protein AE [Lachnospiraceae bacterium]
MNMKGRLRLVFMVMTALCFLWMKPMKVRAAEGTDIWQKMDMDDAENAFKELFPDYRFDGEQVLSLIIQGRIKEAVSALFSGLKESVGAESSEVRMLFVMILILGITAALFSNFTDIFQSRQVSDIAFYFIYLLLITVLLKGFNNAASTVKEMLNRLTVFMQMFVPAYLLAVGTAAGASSAAAYYQLFLMAAYVIEKCYLSLLLPVVYSFILLSVMNGIWMEEKLNLLLDFVEKAVSYAIKITIGIITGFSVLQSLISPVVDSLESSALKKAVSVIPGIG